LRVAQHRPWGPGQAWPRGAAFTAPAQDAADRSLRCPVACHLGRSLHEEGSISLTAPPDPLGSLQPVQPVSVTPAVDKLHGSQSSHHGWWLRGGHRSVGSWRGVCEQTSPGEEAAEELGGTRAPQGPRLPPRPSDCQLKACVERLYEAAAQEHHAP